MWQYPTIKDIMSYPVLTVRPDDKLISAIILMHKHQVGGAVVVEEGKVCGIVTERDVLSAIAKGVNPATCVVRQVMSKNVVTCKPNDTILRAFTLMKRLKIRHLPVLNQGTLVGIISSRDVDWACVNEIFNTTCALMHSLIETLSKFLKSGLASLMPQLMESFQIQLSLQGGEGGVDEALKDAQTVVNEYQVLFGRVKIDKVSEERVVVKVQECPLREVFDEKRALSSGYFVCPKAILIASLLRKRIGKQVWPLFAKLDGDVLENEIVITREEINNAQGGSLADAT
ncbi:MAG: hypothetical protein DRJ31_09085 [Candidatus Methanomethylicota archaeon]|uniref:CBS domain-containing protein n=1 Tax=Thermoproteota archaeon TaxID=2056631 RepID=A0A497EKS0_9CREN|nr:MAG: hypothetical protein DRJ31_09085 [Candidatus Verstraetearchaeota archaeon]